MDLPDKYFTRTPGRAVVAIPLLILVVALVTIVVLIDGLAWYWGLSIAILLSQAFACLFFLAHEVLHGSVVRATWLQNTIAHLGTAPFLFSPDLWRVWHNKVHHGHTNDGDRDPDVVGTLRRYERFPKGRFIYDLTPNSGHWYNYLWLLYWATFQGQLILWFSAKYSPEFRSLERRKPISHTFLYLLIWATLGVLAGTPGFLYVVLLPMMLANATIMAYIATNHSMQPLREKNVPIETTMSVNTYRWIDAIHLNFSHHVEHHLFPKMSMKYAPHLRKWLLANEPDDYLSPPHWKALIQFHRTPRLYESSDVLVGPTTGARVELPLLRDELRSKGRRSPRSDAS